MPNKAMVNFTTSIPLFSVLIIALLQFCRCQKAYPNVSCIARERRALLQFRSSLVDKSNRLSSWSGEDCCNWGGVGCSKSFRHVVKLDLRNRILLDEDMYDNEENYFANCSYNSLAGEINPSLLSLEHLSYLDLSRNNFSGIQIPVFFGSLKNLEYLNLSGAAFVGKIPPDLGNLSHLQHLDLSSFDLSAKSISWVTKLSSLESLHLNFVNLSATQDWFQAINMLPSLMSLKLVDCRLPSLPNHPHVNLTSLTLLDLSWNFFVGENLSWNYSSIIPLWLFNISSLKHLDISGNSFHGPIPDIISQLTSLTSLNLENNELRAPLPNSFGALSCLAHFDMSLNNFDGSLPLGQLHNLTSLTVLDLSTNKFQGAIPSEIGYFRQLKELSLSLNELNGTISPNLSLLSKLEYLDISYNSLVGEISEAHFAKLEKLKRLHLSKNSLTLNVRSSWIPPFQLQSFAMDCVKIGPQFPSWLQTQKNLQFLSMYNASISDNIPDWFAIVHSHINYVDLSFNNMTGKVPKFTEDTSFLGNYRYIMLSSNKFEASPYQFPSNIDTLDISNNVVAGPIPLPEDLRKSSLNYLYLNNNYFNGSIPESICHVRTLKFLDISNNQLSGRLPFCIGNLRDLLVLNLANNSLFGQIPSSFGYIEFLQFLHLNNNKFHGELPLSLQYLRYMQFLDLGENELEGIIPPWIGKHLSKMRILRLQSNNFYGDVPTQLCQLSKLQVLNLAQNNLTGCIPGCFNNFSTMGLNYSDLESFRYYSDSIIRSIYSNNGHEKLLSFMGGRELEYSKNLQHLRSLDLSQNNIIGGIPNELMDLVGLQSLNLSRNHLSGSIPEKIGNLKELLSLDLSMNELFGSIPPSLANLNFIDHLNLSSNKLCGRIPTGNQLQTLDDASIYAENNCLCGKPLSNNCSNEKSSQGNGPSFEHKEDKESSFSWFYAGLGPGFTVGLLGIFSILLFKKSWRYEYFQFVENFSNYAWVWIALKTSKLQRKLPQRQSKQEHNQQLARNMMHSSFCNA